MAVKFALIFIAVFVACQMITAIPRNIREVSTATADSNKSIDEALQSFKAGIDDLLKNIQNNELFHNISSTVEQFGQTVQRESKQIIEKIQTTGAKN